MLLSGPARRVRDDLLWVGLTVVAGAVSVGAPAAAAGARAGAAAALGAAFAAAFCALHVAAGRTVPGALVAALLPPLLVGATACPNRVVESPEGSLVLDGLPRLLLWLDPAPSLGHTALGDAVLRRHYFYHLVDVPDALAVALLFAGIAAGLLLVRLAWRLRGRSGTSASSTEAERGRARQGITDDAYPRSRYVEEG